MQYTCIQVTTAAPSATEKRKMRVTVYSMKPYHNINGHFINIPEQKEFDPKHPVMCPGNEVEAIETISAKCAKEKYGKYMNEPYTVRNGGKSNMTVTVLRLTGRTSADVVKMNR